MNLDVLNGHLETLNKLFDDASKKGMFSPRFGLEKQLTAAGLDQKDAESLVADFFVCIVMALKV